MARLPGLGPRSARRAVLHLIKKRGQLLKPLAQALTTVGETAREC
ncbi:MAG: recombination protein RecR, partial [Octadecabacter sp.]|nr:recombination protein RecR [Octadecabacter sp.]